jgi:serine/threonine-protein kinase RIO1
VLDPRTRLILFKLLNKGFVSVIDGCLSTGKEVGQRGGGGTRGAMG